MADHVGQLEARDELPGSLEARDELPEGMVVLDVPAGRHAVFTHRAGLAKLAHTVDYIWGTWLPRHGGARVAPDFEVYDERTAAGGEGELDIHVPVEPDAHATAG